MVTEYHRTNSVGAVLRSFRQEFPNVRCPSRKTVSRNAQKYRTTGTSHNLNKGRSGRRRTGRSVANIEAVRNRLVEQQQAGEGRAQTISSRRNGLGMPSATFNRITRVDLHFHPYQMIKRHELLPGDQQRRLRNPHDSWTILSSGMNQALPSMHQLTLTISESTALVDTLPLISSINVVTTDTNWLCG